MSNSSSADGVLLPTLLTQHRRRGRRKGTRNKLNPEISLMLGEATCHYAHGRYEEVCLELVCVHALA